MISDFFRVGAAVPTLAIADTQGNAKEIVNVMNKANSDGVKLLVFPELSITGYTCGDLFFHHTLLDGALKGIEFIVKETKHMDMLTFVGAPIACDDGIFNCGVGIFKGEVIAVIAKTFFPNTNEFSEKRWFTSASDLQAKFINICGKDVPIGNDIVFTSPNIPYLKIGVEICQDLWAVIPPSSFMALHGATVLCNLSTSTETAGKGEVRKKLVTRHSYQTNTAYVYATSGMSESSTDLVFSGHSIIAESGELLASGSLFQQESELIYSDIDLQNLASNRTNSKGSYADEARISSTKNYRVVSVDLNNAEISPITRKYSKTPFLPLADKENAYETVLKMQAVALARRLSHVGCKTAVLGVSGGVDSTLALIVTLKAFEFLGKDAKDVIGITMPGFGTTEKTLGSAKALGEALGIDFRSISIEDACNQHFKDIGYDANRLDITFENSQARERTQILMDVANMENGLVVGSSGMSEMALGFSTFAGDQISMYGVNCGLPKTYIIELLSYLARKDSTDARLKDVLLNVISTPISPELLPPDKSGEIEQKTEELMGPYVLTDFFLYHMLKNRFSPKKILFLAGIAFENEYTKEELTARLKYFYKRFFEQQFKRSTSPDGPRLLEVSLSPRGDWRMPSDASYELWVNELEAMA